MAMHMAMVCYGSHMTNTGAATLKDFLLARIAEDEGTALYAQTRDDLQPEDWAGWWFGHHQHYSRYSPARVLAECGAKRDIIADHGKGEAWCDYCADYSDEPSDQCLTLRRLAKVYAAHPDYREEWKP